MMSRRAVSTDRSSGRDEALLDAWERALGYIHALPLEDGGTVAELLDASEKLKPKVEGLLYSASVESTHYDANAVAVVVRIKKRELNQVLGTDFR